MGVGFSDKLDAGKENIEMSSSHESQSKLDRWWPLFLIFFGLMFVTLLVSFHPTN